MKPPVKNLMEFRGKRHDKSERICISFSAGLFGPEYKLPHWFSCHIVSQAETKPSITKSYFYLEDIVFLPGLLSCFEY